MKEFKYIKLSKEDGIGILTLSRPKVNALNKDMLLEIECALYHIENEEKDIRCLIINGDGENFCAGADIKEMKDYTPQEAREFSETGHRILKKLENLRVPVIAAVHGYALGGGCEIMLACDIRVASKNAKIGQPEVKIGVLPGFGGTQRLANLIGKGKAMYLIFTGEFIDAEKAYEIGLVDFLTEEGKHLEKAKEIANKIKEAGPNAVCYSKRAIYYGLSLEKGFEYEKEVFGLLFSTGEPKKGIEAFLEKRKVEW
ncbi:MAG: enoyl-CoA hydratase-related protein [candidate division WOR-3 bacterium]